MYVCVCVCVREPFDYQNLTLLCVRAPFTTETLTINLPTLRRGGVACYRHVHTHTVSLTHTTHIHTQAHTLCQARAQARL